MERDGGPRGPQLIYLCKYSGTLSCNYHSRKPGIGLGCSGTDIEFRALFLSDSKCFCQPWGCPLKAQGVSVS